MTQRSRQTWSLLLTAAASVAVCLAAPQPARAQISRNGNIETLATVGALGLPAIKGSDVAYDPANDAYLVVNAYGAVDGFFADQRGVKVNSFRVKAGAMAQYPRVAYSPDVNGGAGGFLVVWPEENGAVHTRVVAYPGTLVGSDNVISDIYQPFNESAAAVAYSATSRVFLVAWKSVAPDARVRAAIVGLDGARIGSILTLSSGFGRDPGVAWNSATDQFGVSYSAEDANEDGFSCFAVVPAASPTGYTSRECFNQISGLTYVTDAAYNSNTGRYLMTWFQISNQGALAMGQEFDAQGGRLGEVQLLSSTLGSYDALSMVFNPISGTFALVGLDRGNDDLLGAELDASGVRQQAEVTLGPGALVRYPRVGANTEAAEWNASFSAYGLTQIANQVFLTATRSGPVSQVKIGMDSPTQEATLPPAFDVRGWAIDQGATSGTGVDTVHVWAFPDGGGPAVFLGATYNFTARQDVATTYGSNFTNSGFTTAVQGLLAPGGYTIVPYAHSTVTGTFSQVASRHVTIAASIPEMSLDGPQNGATVSLTFTASGWAIDRAATSGVGVDAIHVWAFPTGGGSPIFAGAATLGHERSDVANVYGSQFKNAGFSVTISNLPAGTYTLGAYMHSSVTGTFNAHRVASITVGQTSQPEMALDAPGAGNVSLNSLLAGWAIDRGASSGSGIEAIHVWAFPVGVGQAVWVGAAALGFARPDVAAVFGSSQFTNSGYNLLLTGLERGVQYNIGVYAYSGVSQSFNQSRFVLVTIN